MVGKRCEKGVVVWVVWQTDPINDLEYLAESIVVLLEVPVPHCNCLIVTFEVKGLPCDWSELAGLHGECFFRRRRPACTSNSQILNT